MPGKKSVDVEWRPPYVCLATDPDIGWDLSGRFRPEIESWDLWLVRLDIGHRVEVMYGDRWDGDVVKEVWVYDRVYKRGVIYMATRGGDSNGKV
jgi:hypothetical protein